MVKDKTGVKGWVEIKVFDKYGNLKYEDVTDNLVTNVGKAQFAALVGGIATTPFTYIAIGTDDGTTLALDATNTALGAETARKAATASQVTTTVTNDTLQLQATFSSADGLTGTVALAESGVFDASTAGNMSDRATFAVVNLDWDNGDSIQITWKIQFS